MTNALDQLAEGDLSEGIFEASVPELSRLIRGYLVYFRVRSGDVEELAQEAIVRVYLHRDGRRGRGVASLKAWLRAICRNLAAETGRRLLIPNGVPGKGDPVVDYELRDVLERCLDRLRAIDSIAFRLRYEFGWASRDIADLLGWKIRKCELNLQRARSDMATSLSECGYGPGGVRDETRRELG